VFILLKQYKNALIFYEVNIFISYQSGHMELKFGDAPANPIFR
jgi:hypothetical protein